MGVIYVNNTNTASVLANGIIPNIIARRGNSSSVAENNAIAIRKPGYYAVSGTVTFSAASAGNVTISLQKNSTNVPGITATETITTADTEVRTVAINGVVRVFCHEGLVMLTLVNNSEIDITVTNVSLTVIG